MVFFKMKRSFTIWRRDGARPAWPRFPTRPYYCRPRDIPEPGRKAGAGLAGIARAVRCRVLQGAALAAIAGPVTACSPGESFRWFLEVLRVNECDQYIFRVSMCAIEV